MPANASAATAMSGDEAGIRLEPCVKHRDAVRARARDDIRRRRRGADHQHRMGALELRAERRAQGPGRRHQAVADAAAGSTTSSAKSLASDGF